MIIPHVTAVSANELKPIAIASHFAKGERAYHSP